MFLENPYLDCIIKISASFLCGLLLGIERKTRLHSVGMRTLALICVSCCVLCMISIKITQIPGVINGDPTRITAGIVTGIGFLGGGAILHHGLNIRGLTTAAIILTTMALGVACGAGYFFIAAFALLLILISLVILEKIEWKLFPAEKTKNLTLFYSSNSADISSIKKEIEDSGLKVKDLNTEESLTEKNCILRFSVKASGEFDLKSLTEKLSKNSTLTKIKLSDL